MIKIILRYGLVSWKTVLPVLILAVSTAFAAAADVSLPIGSVSASSNDGNLPGNTLDASLTTRWSADGLGQWITFDLKTTNSVDRVDIAWYEGNQRVERFDIRASVDGIVWKQVFSGSSSGKTLALETYSFTAATARFVSIVGNGNTMNNWNSITDVEIFGATAGGGGGSSPPGTATLPSQVLNLINWKLTLPVNTSHAGNPDEITQPELARFQDAQYFHLNATKNAVVFKANCGGSTTSGSGYPRSELREMALNGLAPASWSTTSGTHTMIITQAITHLPVVKPQIVAGQIHNASSDVIVFRLEGQTLFIDENGKQGPVLTTRYKLGDIFTAAFVARNGAVECYYNGEYIFSYPTKQSGLYFKAGAYTQSNISKGDAASAYGEVTIYGLSVKHQ